MRKALLVLILWIAMFATMDSMFGALFGRLVGGGCQSESLPLPQFLALSDCVQGRASSSERGRRKGQS